ncbi:MAG: hypothetical protein KA239_07045 [Bacteroidia bacterium]|nr:hypothetical protein [Bacteroidia bacterium]
MHVDSVKSVKIILPLGGQSTPSTTVPPDTLTRQVEEMPPQGPEKGIKSIDLGELSNFLWELYFDLPRISIH